jgi:hypothetical protein
MLGGKALTWNTPSVIVTVDLYEHLRDAVATNADPDTKRTLVLRLLWSAAATGLMAAVEAKNMTAKTTNADGQELRGAFIDTKSPGVGLVTAGEDLLTGYGQSSLEERQKVHRPPDPTRRAPLSQFRSAPKRESTTDSPGPLVPNMSGPLLPGADVTYAMQGSFGPTARFKWWCETDPATRGNRPPIIPGPNSADARTWATSLTYAGHHTIFCEVYDGEQLVASGKFVQVVAG